jgi:hypothetical protein
MEKMAEPTMEHLDIMENLEDTTIAKFDSHHERMVARMDFQLEEMRAWRKETEARTETGQGQMDTEIKSGLEEVETADLEAKPEESEATVERQEISNEEAAVENIETLDDRYRDRP